MFSQVSYCKQDKEQSRASKEQYENVENETNHMKNTRMCFQRGKPDHPKKKKKKNQKTKKKTKTKTKKQKKTLRQPFVEKLHEHE